MPGIFKQYLLDELLLLFSLNASYHILAVNGCNFCRGAQQAIALLTSNALRVATINSVGTFVLFMAKIAVVVPTVFIGISIIDVS